MIFSFRFSNLFARSLEGREGLSLIDMMGDWSMTMDNPERQHPPGPANVSRSLKRTYGYIIRAVDIHY